jgi:UDPglucose 6-dehydrogenase
MAGSAVLDTRNHLDADAVARAGLVLHGLGRELRVPDQAM